METRTIGAEAVVSAQNKQSVGAAVHHSILKSKTVSREPGRGDRIAEFALQYRLRLGRDELGEKIIPGKLGDIYEYGPTLLGVMFMPDPPRARLWPAARKKLLSAGFHVLQNGDWEGAATFDPDNPAQAKLAIGVAKIKRIRVLSPAETEARRECMQRVNTRRRSFSSRQQRGSSAVKLRRIV
jgi:hypothetical protein